MATEQQKRPEDNIDDLVSMYSEVRGQEPTSDLDASILAAARAETAGQSPAEPRRPVAEAWRTPFAAVASVMLCTVIYFSLPDPDTADYLPIPGVADPGFEVPAAPAAPAAPAEPAAVGSMAAAPAAAEKMAPQRPAAASMAEAPADRVSSTPLVSYSEDRAAEPVPPQSAGESGRYESFADHQARGRAATVTAESEEPAGEWSPEADLAAKSAPAETVARLVTTATSAPETPDTRTLPQPFLDALRDGLVQRIHVAGDMAAESDLHGMGSEAATVPAFTLETSCAMPAGQDGAPVLLLLLGEQEAAPVAAAGESAGSTEASALARSSEALCVRVVTGQDGLPEAFAHAWASMRADGTVRRLLDQYGLQQWSPR